MKNESKQSITTVIIPLHNKENWITSTLESVKNQTYKNWECLIIDDGSTDQSRKLVEQYIAKNPDYIWKYFYRKNVGQAATRNYGIANANGIYITFLDADDLWLPKKLENEISFLEKNTQFDAVLSDYMIFNLSSRVNRVVKIRNTRKFLTKWLKMTGFGALPESNGLWKTKCIRTIDGFNEDFSTSSGLDMVLRFIQKFNIGVTGQVNTFYRISFNQWHRLPDELNKNVNMLFNSQYGLSVSNLNQWQKAYLLINHYRDNLIKRFIQDLIKRKIEIDLLAIVFLIATSLSVVKRNFLAYFYSIKWLSNGGNKNVFETLTDKRIEQVHD